jgi:hypothetical protein
MGRFRVAFVLVALSACARGPSATTPDAGAPSEGGAGGTTGVDAAAPGEASAGSTGTVDAVAPEVGAGGADAAPPTGDAGLACAPLVAPAVPDDPQGMPAADPALAAPSHKFFKITVKDATSGAPIPGATLTTVNKIVLTSDKNGVVAFYEPGLMGQDVYFEVKHPGWEMPADAFGGHGKALKVTEGGAGDLALAKTTGTSVASTDDLQTRLAAGAVPGRAQCMAIRVVDRASGRGVPVVDLAAFGEHAWSDSQGMIAYCNPDHVRATAQSVSFDVASHGARLVGGATKTSISVVAGGSATVEVERTMLGERLYRITGAGLYRDSVVLGLRTPLANPTLVARVAGSDTGSVAIYKGKLFWLWQDTDRVGYWLGNFKGTGATSPLPGAWSADRGPDLTYFQGSDGFAAPMCPSCEGGPAWMAGLVSVPDAAGVETLFAGYAIVNGDGSSRETGLARFDDAKASFDRVITDFATRTNFQRPDGHAVKLGRGADAYVHYFDRLRIPATAQAFLAPATYEQFSPYAAGGAATLVRDGAGRLDYEWRAGARTVDSAALKAAGVGTDEDLDGHVVATQTGGSITLTSNSLAWSAHRGRFVRIAQQVGGGTSLLGELWHLEGDTPMGPWVHAEKVLTHDNYTFYNAFHHPELERGRFLYFEGTYTSTYTNATPTPRYNYNQQMIRVDLDDARLALPVPVYDASGALPGSFVTKRGLRRAAPATAAPFLALDRAARGAVPVAWSTASCGTDRRLTVGGAPATTPLFYALPADTAASAQTAPLYEYAAADGRRAYGLADATVPAGFTRAAKALAVVWRNPIRVALPVGSYLGDLVVDAGADQCVSAGGQGTVEVALDASATSVLGGTVKSARWSVPGAAGCAAVDGTTARVRLTPGVHEVTLEVVDSNGNQGTDAVTIVVAP